MTGRICLFFMIILLGTNLFSCADKVRVFVSILPQEYFVERVGGDHVEVKALVRPGHSPATYSVTPSQMVDLARADLFFSTGVPFENALIPRIKANLKKLKIVDTTQGITRRKMNADTGADHHHDHHSGCDHSGEGLDPHVWMNPLLVKQQAATICAALCTEDPDNAEKYRKNLKTFSSDLDELNRKLKKALAPVKGRDIFVFHPAYGYFADAYGLKQVAVEAGGKEPSARELISLIKNARKQKVRVVFVQPQFSDKSARVIAREINGTVCKLDPLARDYIKNMTRIARRITHGISGNPEK